ncbi:hypothetical protein ACH42_04645 [Endozoicomonas sp. (ex Bugula neritina AB1)]|nr:hypothetical protein ACH42_04645 [Endozoicomonas sp. (ex Bugula neritina AB1)]
MEKAAGELELIDARSNHYLLPELKRRNIDLNDGMVVLIGDEIYQGKEATYVLVGMTQKSSLFNRCAYEVFSRSWLSGVVYFAMRLLRSILLLLLRRKPIS